MLLSNLSSLRYVSIQFLRPDKVGDLVEFLGTKGISPACMTSSSRPEDSPSFAPGSFKLFITLRDEVDAMGICRLNTESTADPFAASFGASLLSPPSVLASSLHTPMRTLSARN
jgi:hypothetical protein